MPGCTQDPATSLVEPRVVVTELENASYCREYSTPKRPPIPPVSFKSRHGHQIELYDSRRLMQKDRRRAHSVTAQSGVFLVIE